MLVFTKDPNDGIGTGRRISPNPQCLQFLENFETRWCRNTPEVNQYPRKAIKVVLNDGVEWKRISIVFSCRKNNVKYEDWTAYHASSYAP